MRPKRRTRRSERRATARADARLSMRLEGARDVAARAQIVTESQNISASGVYCMSPHYLAPLSKIDLTIVLPKLPGTRGAKELIKCEGIVVRCEAAPVRPRSDKHFELACMFSDLDERRRRMLEEFVTWRNLQSLRAAADSANGTERPQRAAVRRSTAKTPARRAAKSATTRRKRTLH